MSTEDVTAIESTEEEQRLSRRQLAQQAISLAVQSRWQEATDANRQIVAMAPDDAEAFNRLGKSLTEIGKIGEARQAYESALKADPANLIAQRNLDRLSLISEEDAAGLGKKGGIKLDPKFFIEETGKTGMSALGDGASAAVLATLTAGDRVELERRDGGLVVTSIDGTYLGKVEKKTATRLARLIKSGNEYQAGVVGVDERSIRIIIRETRQAPENVGRISFPPRGKEQSMPRPYLREGLMRRAGGEEDEEEDVDIDTDGEADDDEEEDASEFGFHEASLEES